MNMIYGNFDISGFWDNGDYSLENYVCETLTDELVKSIEKELEYRLPQSYIELMKQQNGGTPVFTSHRTKEATSWADDHIAINGIYGISKSKPYSLCGSMGSQFWINEWGYPAIGIYFADCPSAGHDMLCLDYSQCGSEGEPRVVHVDQEAGYKITFVAKNFEEFIRNLEEDEAFEDDDLDENNDGVTAWIDPEFAKELGMDVPNDGWVKNRNNRSKQAILGRVYVIYESEVIQCRPGDRRSRC
jgi:hypothetical protein